MDERHRDREAGVHVGFLGGDPAEVLEAGQAAVLDHEVQVGEVRGDVIDVGDVERVPVQRPDRGSLVDVDVADAEFAAGFEVPVRPRIVELPAARLPVPLGGVELDALQVVLLGVEAQLLEADLAVAGVEVVVVGQLVGVRAGQVGGLGGLAEPLVVELAEVGRLEDGVVDVAELEQVAHQPLAALVQVVLVAPHLGIGGEVAVVVVEAVDELLAVDVALVFRAGVPQRDVASTMK